MQADPTDPRLDSEPASQLRPTFALRAQRKREEGRAQAMSDVAAIRQRGEAQLRTLRQQHAIELAAARGVAASRAPRWLLQSLAVATVIGTVMVVLLAWSPATLSEDDVWIDVTPEQEVRLALSVSNATAEPERASAKRSPRYRPPKHRNDTIPCKADPFDPMNDCF